MLQCLQFKIYFVSSGKKVTYFKNIDLLWGHFQKSNIHFLLEPIVRNRQTELVVHEKGVAVTLKLIYILVDIINLSFFSVIPAVRSYKKKCGS